MASSRRAGLGRNSENTSGMPIAIRAAGAGDAALLSELRVRAHLERHDGEPSAHATFLAACEAFFSRALADRTVRAWFAFDGERAVGVAALHLIATLPRAHACDVARGTLDGRVRNVYVDPEYRRRGIARALMREVLAEAARERVDRLALGTSTMGKLLYERMGFVPKDDEMIFGDSP